MEDWVVWWMVGSVQWQVSSYVMINPSLVQTPAAIRTEYLAWLWPVDNVNDVIEIPGRAWLLFMLPALCHLLVKCMAPLQLNIAAHSWERLTANN